MRLIIQIRPSSRSQSLLLELEHQASPEASKATRRRKPETRFGVCGTVAAELPLGAILRPLPGPLVLSWNAPMGSPIEFARTFDWLARTSRLSETTSPFN